ncbi:MAG: hypothetical protein HUJ25_04600 [Crocinitomicaceae bacterium]|nr:hypothetical protein [Crocinitomicaceae bacterium]
MSKKAQNKYKREISDRIRKFGNQLKSNGLIQANKPFEDAANQCLNGLLPEVKGVNIDKANSWGYELSNVIINVPKPKKSKGIFPQGTIIKTLAISTKIIGNYTRNDYVEDPFAHLEFNLIIKGDFKGQEMIACWHLDRHLENKGDNDPNDLHPTYHMQYGGKKLKLPNDNYGTHVVLETPRLLHLPLDGILGVDFVLGNFLGEQRKELCSKKPYWQCIKASQDSIWRPFIHAFAKRWDAYNPLNYNWEVEKICPQLVKISK